jgi:hypothetical protein
VAVVVVDHQTAVQLVLAVAAQVKAVVADLAQELTILVAVVVVAGVQSAKTAALEL